MKTSAATRAASEREECRVANENAAETDVASSSHRPAAAFAAYQSRSSESVRGVRKPYRSFGATLRAIKGRLTAARRV